MSLKSKVLSIILQKLYPVYNGGDVIVVWGKFGKQGGFHAIIFNPDYEYKDHLGGNEVIPRIHSDEEWRHFVKDLIPYRISITKRS